MRSRMRHVNSSVPAFLTVLLVSGTVIAQNWSDVTIKSKPVTTPAAIAAGKAIYEKQCATCHGLAGDGNGTAAYLLYPKPRDLTKGAFKVRSTLSGELPTDEDLFRTIAVGLAGTAMPGWADLSETERWQVVAYIKTFSDRFTATSEPPKPVQIREAVPSSPESIARGKNWYTELGCHNCHGLSGKGDGSSAAELRDDWGYPIRPYDFTRPGRYKGGATARDIYRTFVTGMTGTPMPSFGEVFETPEQARQANWDLANYVKSLSQDIRKPTILPDVEITAKPVKVVPTTPYDNAWDGAVAADIPLRPLQQRDDYPDRVRVRSLYDGSSISFLLEWDDPTADMRLLLPQDFRDAAAVQFALGPVAPFFGMGQQGTNVNIWHWKADWQADLAKYVDVEDIYPSVASDQYLFQKGMSPAVLGTSSVPAATAQYDPTYLTGQGVGNLVSNPFRKSPVEDVNAAGQGTLTSQPSADQ
ncbi:MAG: c-type cytochrome, partial [Candidatus Latescibacteria bacterium]|nr:c-type cytochrome [Candidatus Latescibacterota bacterium]